MQAEAFKVPFLISNLVFLIELHVEINSIMDFFPNSLYMYTSGAGRRASAEQLVGSYD